MRNAIIITPDGSAVCPKCGAYGDAPCKNGAGKPSKKEHAARTRAQEYADLVSGRRSAG